MISQEIYESREINEELKCFAVLNGADSQGKDNEEAAKAIMEYKNLEYLPCIITRRKAFPNSAAVGRSVFEVTPRDQKAVNEMKSLEAGLFNK